MPVKWADRFLGYVKEKGIPCKVNRRVHGWPETVVVARRTCFTKSGTYKQERRQYFLGVDPGKLEEDGDYVLLCGGIHNSLRDVFLIPWNVFFKTLSQGRPLNTYKPPKEYYQYKLVLRETDTGWDMIVQGGDHPSVNITAWRYDPNAAVDFLRRG